MNGIDDWVLGVHLDLKRGKAWYKKDGVGGVMSDVRFWPLAARREIDELVKPRSTER